VSADNPEREPPLLTEVLGAGATPTPQEWLLRALPPLLAEAVAELQPQLEQQLLDALMPRLLASLSRTQPASTPDEALNRSRLP
jgi:hypothetical protein